jgi:hypothetical protein
MGSAGLFTIAIGVLAAGLLVAVLVRLQNVATKKDIEELSRYAQLGRAKVLVDKIQEVKVGKTKKDVELLLGRADNPAADEWFYYLDDHAGYILLFDGHGRVEAVNSWKS